MSLLAIYILFCAFNINQIINARSSSSNYQIDEFIAQLMTSEKFNELADIIAERAAKKIKNENNSTSKLPNTSKNHKKVKNKKLNKEKLNDKELPHESMLRQRKEVPDKSGKFGKINIKTFLKRGASSQELFLNYKHMTEDLNKNSEKYEAKKKGQRSEHNDNFSDNSSEQYKLDSGSSEKHMKASKSEENITKARSFTSEEKHLNNEDKHKNRDTTPSDFKTSEPSLSDEHTQENTINDSTDKKTTQLAKNDNIPSDSSHFEIKEDEKKTSEDAVNDPSKEVVVVGLDTKSGELSEPQTLVKIEYSSSNSKETKPLEKQIVRRENGKLYTYLSSPDYEEYHEDMKNQRLSDNRYINTYK